MSVEFSNGEVWPLESGNDGDASSKVIVDGGAGDGDVSIVNRIAGGSL